MAEKARRWTLERMIFRLNGHRGEWRLVDPALGPEGAGPYFDSETIEVAEVSALRAEWEAELMSDEALQAAARAYWQKDTAVGNERRAREAVEAALYAAKGTDG